MKSQFFGTLSADHIEGKWWKLTKPLGYYSESLDITICGPIGFVTDFSSVPRLPFAYWLAGGTGNWESIPHDVGYRYGLIDRWKLDYMFYESGRVRTSMRKKQSLLLNTFRWVRTTGMTVTVMLFGWASFNSKPGCLDYREKCNQKCLIDPNKCENYYKNWRECILPGYRPDIIELHGS